MVANPRPRKYRLRQRGSALVEATLALAILTVVGLVLLQLALNVLTPRQWVLHQTLADAYLTYERSYGERIPFSSLVGGNSPWPEHPSATTSTVEIGRLPGGTPVNGTLTRARLPDPNNFPLDGGSGSVATNPSGMKVWKVQSVLTYAIGGRSYAKSRTVIRSQ
jgi:hypothetical protein